MATAKANSNKHGQPSREQTVINQLCELVTENKARLLMYKHQIPNYQDTEVISEEKLRTYFSTQKYNTPDDLYNRYKYEPSFQNAEKLILKIKHGLRLAELYEIYFEKAKTDTQAFQKFTEFSDKYFANEKESGLTALLNGIDLGDE